MTKYEKKILDIINISTDHMTSEEIFLKLKQEESKVVLATIYNNLNKLYENGDIIKLSIPGQPERYDKKIRHDHLVCNVCKKIADYNYVDLTKSLKKELGDSFIGYDLKISYTCPECKKLNSDKN